MSPEQLFEEAECLAQKEYCCIIPQASREETVSHYNPKRAGSWVWFFFFFFFFSLTLLKCKICCDSSKERLCCFSSAALSIVTVCVQSEQKQQERKRRGAEEEEKPNLVQHVLQMQVSVGRVEMPHAWSKKRLLCVHTKVSAAENAGGKGALQQQDAPKRCL